MGDDDLMLDAIAAQLFRRTHRDIEWASVKKRTDYIAEALHRQYLATAREYLDIFRLAESYAKCRRRSPTMPDAPATREDQWVIVEPGVIVLPTTGYEIRREVVGGMDAFQPYHNGKRMAGLWALWVAGAKDNVSSHMRDLLAVGIEP
jgi:hypothetical protein